MRKHRARNLEIPGLVPTFRSSCSIAAPTLTNFGKSWALANLLILVPLHRSEVPDRIRRSWSRDFRSAVLALAHHPGMTPEATLAHRLRFHFVFAAEWWLLPDQRRGHACRLDHGRGPIGKEPARGGSRAYLPRAPGLYRNRRGAGCRDGRAHRQAPGPARRRMDRARGAARYFGCPDRNRRRRRAADRLPDALVVEPASRESRLDNGHFATRRRLEASAESRHHGDERGRARHCARQRARPRLSRCGRPHEPDHG